MRGESTIRVFLLNALLSLISIAYLSACQKNKDHTLLYAVAELPTPVLNTDDFSSVFGGKDGKTLHLDDAGLIREVEFIAFPETAFTIEAIIKKGASTVYRVTTEEYPYPTPQGYFIDSRFVKTIKYKPHQRIKILPDTKAIIRTLLSSEGSSYIWGGNYTEGIPQMLSFYPPSYPVDRDLTDRWMLKGVDCSGLLYRATNGWTPRNTSSLITYGEPVKIAGLSISQIIEKVEPLDILGWKGHLIIILDRKRSIESRPEYDRGQEGNQGGVMIRTLSEVVTEIVKERKPVDNYGDEGVEDEHKFVIRRWHPKTPATSLPLK